MALKLVTTVWPSPLTMDSVILTGPAAFGTGLTVTVKLVTPGVLLGVTTIPALVTTPGVSEVAVKENIGVDRVSSDTVNDCERLAFSGPETSVRPLITGRVVMLKNQPLLIMPKSPDWKSCTYRDQVPFGLLPLKAFNVFV